ncbi:starch synthase, partial [Enterococcus faecalis]
YEVYDPGTDPLITAHFSSADLSSKEKDKQALRTKMNLPGVAEVPLIGMVSRLTYQKGFPLVLSTIHELLQHDVQVVLLGTGDPALEEAFQQLAK